MQIWAWEGISVGMVWGVAVQQANIDSVSSIIQVAVHKNLLIERLEIQNRRINRNWMYPAQGNPQYTPSCVFDVEKEGIDLDRDELQALLSDKAPVKQTKSANLVISTIEMEDEMVIDNDTMDWATDFTDPS